jgi:hypothetical protein
MYKPHHQMMGQYLTTAYILVTSITIMLNGVIVYMENFQMNFYIMFQQ